MPIPISLLERHVRESNLIEGISVPSDSPLFTSHLHAAITVAEWAIRGELLDPMEIHAMICRDTDMESFGGRIRTCGMCVGENICPKWEEVPRLMDEWRERVTKFDIVQSETRTMRAFVARWLHNEFLCIHPAEDGNGRTARLTLNQLRLRYRLPWLIIDARGRGAYYRGIRRTEEVFKARHQDVYPKLELTPDGK